MSRDCLERRQEDVELDNLAHIDLVATPENFEKGLEWAAMCDQLRRQLSAETELTVSIPLAGTTPKNAKGEPITIGALVIALASAPAVINLHRV
jgi:hypothetical protein